MKAPGSNKILKFQYICVFALFLAVSCNAAVTQKNMTWYYSADPAGKLTTDSDNVITWYPSKPEQLIVHIPQQRLTQTGDIVTFKLTWGSDGSSGCDCANVTHFYDYFCNDDAVTCLAGTGDFRMGLFDSNGNGYVTADGMGTDNSIFNGYLGYAWRFFPHLAPNTIERVYQHKSDGSVESHTNLSFWQRNTPYENSLLSTSNGYDRIEGPVACGFDLPLGGQAMMTLKLERLSSSSVKMTINFNGYEYSKTDSTSAYQPLNIDVFAIQFPNGRPYDYVTFDVQVDGYTDADILEDCIIDGRDLRYLSIRWLVFEDPNLLGTAPDANYLLLHYKLDETSGNIAHDTSTNGMDGVISGTTLWKTEGHLNNCLNFHDNAVINPPTNVLASITDQITISAWVKGGNFGSRDNWLFDTGTDPYLGAILPDSATNIVFDGCGDILYWLNPQTEDLRAYWVHWAFVKNAASGFMAIYRNGEKVAEKLDAFNPINSIANTIFDIGAAVPHVNDFIGDIDEFKIYNYALSDDEVLYLAQDGKLVLDQPANINKDEIINLEDYALLAQSWLYECPTP